MAVIETHGLTKHYGRVVAVEDLNLEVKEGEVFGLLGPNGSGKTTTILMLLGLTEPTRGEARVLGLDPMREPLKVKAQVGYLPDQVGFYGELTAWENLRYTTRLLGLPEGEAKARIEEVLKRMGLWEVRDRRVFAFSRGMRQRLGLAEVLLKRPKVAILDEPTLGLDPEAARGILGPHQGLEVRGHHHPPLQPPPPPGAGDLRPGGALSQGPPGPSWDRGGTGAKGFGRGLRDPFGGQPGPRGGLPKPRGCGPGGGGKRALPRPGQP